LVLLGGPKMGFSTCSEKNVKFGTGKRTVFGGRNVGIQPPKLSKFRILAIHLLLRGHSFAQFVQNSQISSVSIALSF